MLVQLPLPKQINAHKVLETVSPAKDIDGFHAVNLGALVAGKPQMVPCTPAGVMATRYSWFLTSPGIPTFTVHTSLALAGARRPRCRPRSTLVADGL